MPNTTSARLTFALLLTVALIDLQLYLYRYHKPKEMLGHYLRRQIDHAPCSQLAATAKPARRCTFRQQERDVNAPFPPDTVVVTSSLAMTVSRASVVGGTPTS